LRAVLRQEEGWGSATALRERFFAATGATSANDLLHLFYTTDYPRPLIAGYSKLVDEAAREGDTVARDILHSCAQHLATLTAAVRGSSYHPTWFPPLSRRVVQERLCARAISHAGGLEDGNRVQTFIRTGGGRNRSLPQANIHTELTAAERK
jgi:hypothetical protein